MEVTYLFAAFICSTRAARELIVPDPVGSDPKIVKDRPAPFIVVIAREADFLQQRNDFRKRIAKARRNMCIAPQRNQPPSHGIISA